MTEFLTDGRRLFEVIAADIRRNYGRGGEYGSFLREVALRDCVTEEVRFLLPGPLSKLRPVAVAA